MNEFFDAALARAGVDGRRYLVRVHGPDENKSGVAHIRKLGATPWNEIH